MNKKPNLLTTALLIVAAGVTGLSKDLAAQPENPPAKVWTDEQLGRSDLKLCPYLQLIEPEHGVDRAVAGDAPFEEGVEVEVEQPITLQRIDEFRRIAKVV